MLSVLVLGGCKNTSRVWVGPSLSLPEAAHAYAFPVRRILMVPSGGTMDQSARIEDVCSTPQSSGLPASLVAPAVATLGPDGLSWMGVALGRVTVDESSGGALTYTPHKPLLEAVEASRKSTQTALELCRVPRDAWPMMIPILAIDARVPLSVVHRVVYTMGMAQMSGVGLLVRDPNPEGTRKAKPVGGISLKDDSESLIGDLVALGGGLEWRDDDAPPLRLPQRGPYPRNLGLPGPPKVGLFLGVTSSFGAFITIQDALAGADVFCVSPAVSDRYRPAPEVVRLNVASSPPTPVKLDRMGTAAIHLWSFGMAGCSRTPGDSLPFIERVDGARCTPFVKMERRVLEDLPSFKGLELKDILKSGKPLKGFGD